MSDVGFLRKVLHAPPNDKCMNELRAAVEADRERFIYEDEIEQLREENARLKGGESCTHIGSCSYGNFDGYVCWKCGAEIHCTPEGKAAGIDYTKFRGGNPITKARWLRKRRA